MFQHPYSPVFKSLDVNVSYHLDIREDCFFRIGKIFNDEDWMKIERRIYPDLVVWSIVVETSSQEFADMVATMIVALQ